MRIDRDTLKLSFGQVATALCLGRSPDPVTLDRLRYLRQLGVPFSEKEGQGSGNRLTYKFDHLAECGIAIESIRRGLKPIDAAKTIASRRKDLRKLARDAFDEIPEDLHDDFDDTAPGLHWARIEEEILLHLNGRHEDRPWTFDYLTGGQDLEDDPSVFVPLADGSHREMIHLKRYLLSWVVRGVTAPPTRPGRQ